MQPPSDPTAIDAYLEMRERGVPALRHGCEKRVLWANEDRSKTPVSAFSCMDFRPVQKN